MLKDVIDLPLGEGLTLSIQRVKNSVCHAYVMRANGRLKAIHQINSAETLAKVILKTVKSESEKRP